jgi:hypothetical protein
VVLKPGRRVLVLAGACAVGAAACGAGLAPGTSADRPLYAFGAQLGSSNGIPPDARPRLGVIWTDPLQRQSDVPMPADWLGSNLDRDTFGGFLTSVYRRPPPAAMVRIDSPSGSDWMEMAFGEVIIFDDAEQNGVFRIDGPRAEMAAPDRYLASSEEVLVYVARPFSNAQDGFPLGPAILPGYTTLAFFCNGPVPGQQIRQNVGMQFVAQPSQTLPEIRTCLRTHTP